MAQAGLRVRKTSNNTQYTYNLNRRIHDTKTYPTLSPQGASILLIGHANGVTILWRGGRRFKRAKAQASRSAPSTQNGDDSMVILDSDDEDEAAAPSSPAAFIDKPEFEDAPSNGERSGVPEVVQMLDLAFGTAAKQIAVLPTSAPGLKQSGKGSDIEKNQLVFAVSCANNDAYVVMLPSTPPSHESKAREELRKDLLAGNAGRGAWGETLISLGGLHGSIAGLAMTRLDDAHTVKGQAAVVVAAHSPEASGTLRLWSVPLKASKGAIEPFQTQYLATPLRSITFNPTNTTQLLVVDQTRAVRIYDYATSSIFGDDQEETALPMQGSWLLSLYPPFAKNLTNSRKPIIGAEWISHGKAVMVLLADGQWGIWDVAGAGPEGAGSEKGLFGKHGAGIRGTAITAFSATGRLEGTGAGIAADKLAGVHGGVTVARFANATASGETVALWLRGPQAVVSIMLSVSKVWDAQLRRASGATGSLFGSSDSAKTVRLTDLSSSLLGENCTGVIITPLSHSSSASEDGSAAKTASPEMIVQGESRLVAVHSNSSSAVPPDRRILKKLKTLRPANELGSTDAIIVYPREDGRPVTTPFKGTLSRARSSQPARTNLFDQEMPPPLALINIDDDESAAPMPFASASPTRNPFASPERTTGTAANTNTLTPSRAATLGFEFADDLDEAAEPDAGMDTFDALERDIDKEVMDIMEIDQALEDMEADRQTPGGNARFRESTRNLFTPGAG